MPTSPPRTAPRAWIVDPSDTPEVRIWGLTPEERLRRSLRSAGCVHSERVGVDAERPEVPAASGSALLFRSDVIFDPRLVAALATAENTLLVEERNSGDAFAGPVAAHVDATNFAEALALLRDPKPGDAGVAADLCRRTPVELVPSYIAALRKAQPPYVIPARPERVPAIEAKLFGAAYKSTTDLVTKWLWPLPAAAVTRFLARRHVHPNAVTIASWILAGLVALLFAEGAFGLGLIVAWIMTFLDTVDGKLARVTLTSSDVGQALDHGLDLVHPPIWYLAWGYGVSGGIDAATAVVVAGYLAGRLLEGGFLLAFKMETHCWKPIDSLFRTITARRNPNMILLSVATLAAAPELGMEMVATWTVASIGFHVVRLIQAFVARAKGEVIEPWDATSAVERRPAQRTQAAGERAA